MRALLFFLLFPMFSFSQNIDTLSINFADTLTWDQNMIFYVSKPISETTIKLVPAILLCADTSAYTTSFSFSFDDNRLTTDTITYQPSPLTYWQFGYVKMEENYWGLVTHIDYLDEKQKPLPPKTIVFQWVPRKP